MISLLFSSVFSLLWVNIHLFLQRRYKNDHEEAFILTYSFYCLLSLVNNWFIDSSFLLYAIVVSYYCVHPNSRYARYLLALLFLAINPDIITRMMVLHFVVFNIFDVMPIQKTEYDLYVTYTFRSVIVWSTVGYALACSNIALIPPLIVTMYYL